MLNRWRKIVKIWLKCNRKRWGNWQHGKGIQNIQKDTTPMNFGRHDWNMHCKSSTSIRTTNDNMPERNCRRLKTKIVNCHTSPKGLRPTTPKHECQILHPKTTPNNQTWQPNATIQFMKPNKQIYQIHEIPQPKTITKIRTSSYEVSTNWTTSQFHRQRKIMIKMTHEGVVEIGRIETNPQHAKRHTAYEFRQTLLKHGVII